MDIERKKASKKENISYFEQWIKFTTDIHDILLFTQHFDQKIKYKLINLYVYIQPDRKFSLLVIN